MGSNIEVKVKATDFLRQMAVAEQISDTPLEIINQEDTFFEVPNGRLKLREFTAGVGELIFYHRSDKNEIRESAYIISKTSDAASLKAILNSVLGIKGVVRKKRRLFIKGQTRIHFDEVENLGQFIEFEYVLKEGEDHHQAQAFVAELMSVFNISLKDIISSAYIDLLNQDRKPLEKFVDLEKNL